MYIILMMIIILYNPGDGLDPWLYHSKLFFEGTQESIMASWPFMASASSSDMALQGEHLLCWTRSDS